MAYKPWRPAVILLEILFCTVISGLILLYSYRPNWDIDIYWHIKVGEWISEYREIPRRDIFSAVDQHRPWTPFQWLYEVLVYQIEVRAGFKYVRALHAALYLAGFAGLYMLFRREVGGRIAAAFLLLLSLVLMEDRLRIRPEAFNFFFVTLVLPDLMAREIGKWGLVRIGVVGALWANVHAGGALLLPICAFAVLGGRALGKHWGGVEGRLLWDSARFAGALAPMLVMPGFLPGVKTAFSMYKESAVLIPEWHPPIAYFVRELAGRFTTHHAICGAFPYLFLFFLAGLTVSSVLRTGLKGFLAARDAGLLAMAWVLALLAAYSARFVFLDGLAVFIVAVVYRAEVNLALSRMGVRIFVMCLTVVLAGISYEYSVILQRNGLVKALQLAQYDHEPGHFPERASDAIAGMGLEGRIFHFTKWGGYLIYRHYPLCTVFTDGRGNFTAEEKAVLVKTHRPYEREGALEEAWQKYRFDIVIFPSPVFPLLVWDTDKWMLIYQDEMSEVFLRREGNEENVKRVLRFWAARGIDTRGGIVGFQREYRRVLGTEYLLREDVRERLTSAARRIHSRGLQTKASAYYDLGLILFAAGRYDRAARAFEQVLKMGFRHSTALLYVAWSRLLEGDGEGARRAVLDLIYPRGEIALKEDFGPLLWAGKQILKLLSEKLGMREVQVGE